MGYPLFDIPLVPQYRHGDRYEMPLGELMRIEDYKLGKHLSPMEIAKREIEDAVREVREAQDAVGKGIWEDEV